MLQTSMMNLSGQDRPTRREAGFTLLELLVVVLIIGLLASYVGPKYFAQIGKSEIATARAQIDAYAKAVDNFRLDEGRFPTTEEGLAILMTRPADDDGRWNGPYLRKNVIPDPWGRPYVYRSPGTKSEYEILSYGRDGQANGAGVITNE